jgi:hypothetical protein
MTKPRTPKRPAAGKPSEVPVASDADALAFRAAVSDVRPLRASPRVAPPARVHRRRITARAATEAEIDLPGPLVAADVLPEETLSFHRPGVRDQMLRRLRRGLLPICMVTIKRARGNCSPNFLDSRGAAATAACASFTAKACDRAAAAPC